jgi:hypothetical protein
MSLATPLAHGASPGPLNTGSGALPDLDRESWHREMERAMSATWFRFDDAAASNAQPRPQEAATTAEEVPSGTAATRAPSAHIERAPVARGAVQSPSAPSNATRTRTDDRADDATTATNVALHGATPGNIAIAGAALASGNTIRVPGEALPAPALATAPAMSKQPAGAPITPAALPPAPVVSAPLGEAIAATLAAALANAPMAGATSGSTAEEPTPPPAPTPAMPHDVPSAFRDLFGPPPTESTATEASPAAEEARTARDEPASAEPAPPLRWHAEWDEQGVRVWLGLDSAAGIDAPELAQQVLQSLGEQGVRVRSLICNGKSLYGTPRDPNPQSDRRES